MQNQWVVETKLLQIIKIDQGYEHMSVLLLFLTLPQHLQNGNKYKPRGTACSFSSEHELVYNELSVVQMETVGVVLLPQLPTCLTLRKSKHGTKLNDPKFLHMVPVLLLKEQVRLVYYLTLGSSKNITGPNDIQARCSSDVISWAHLLHKFETAETMTNSSRLPMKYVA